MFATFLVFLYRVSFFSPGLSRTVILFVSSIPRAPSLTSPRCSPCPSRYFPPAAASSPTRIQHRRTFLLALDELLFQLLSWSLRVSFNFLSLGRFRLQTPSELGRRFCQLAHAVFPLGEHTSESSSLRFCFLVKMFDETTVSNYSFSGLDFQSFHDLASTSSFLFPNFLFFCPSSAESNEPPVHVSGVPCPGSTPTVLHDGGLSLFSPASFAREKHL